MIERGTASELWAHLKLSTDLKAGLPGCGLGELVIATAGNQ